MLWARPRMWALLLPCRALALRPYLPTLPGTFCMMSIPEGFNLRRDVYILLPPS